MQAFKSIKDLFMHINSSNLHFGHIWLTYFGSCFHVVRNGFILAIKKMHPSFESLVVIDTQSQHASLMAIHHNTFFRSILEDDFISSASRARIRSCLGKGARLWLIVKPFIHSFCIAHFIFTSMLNFYLGLI